LVDDYDALAEDGLVNAAIEIPAGEVEKWEVNKDTGRPELEEKDGKPRIINYLGYPANYGMIPGTYLPKDMGGDGDPLDVLILGEPLERGSVVQCRIIGALALLDRGEQDDKLIAVLPNSKFGHLKTIGELHSEFSGLTNIIETWFQNYKGPGKMKTEGFLDNEEAMKVLRKSIKEYKKH
jgi:inorganic pyrophosphatase